MKMSREVVGSLGNIVLVVGDVANVDDMIKIRDKVTEGEFG